MKVLHNANDPRLKRLFGLVERPVATAIPRPGRYFDPLPGGFGDAEQFGGCFVEQHGGRIGHAREVLAVHKLHVERRGKVFVGPNQVRYVRFAGGTLAPDFNRWNRLPLARYPRRYRCVFDRRNLTEFGFYRFGPTPHVSAVDIDHYEQFFLEAEVFIVRKPDLLEKNDGTNHHHDRNRELKNNQSLPKRRISFTLDFEIFQKHQWTET